MRLVVVLWLLFGFAAIPAAAQTVEIDIDTSLAGRMLEFACSGQQIDAAEFERSPFLKAQLAHHSSFGATMTLANYLKGVEAIARCEAPDPDPFRFAALVQKRQDMTKAIRFLAAREKELGREAAALITPYVPQGVDFRGAAVFVPASFSCGGFAQDGAFFVDVPCVAQDVEEEYDALVRLVAHETYHAIQSRFMPEPAAGPKTVKTTDQAREFIFHRLATEGSASHVADMRAVKGNGRYTRFSRTEARKNFGHLAYNFLLFDYVVELLGYQPQSVAKRLEELHRLAFHGAVGQPGYYVGQQMAAEISSDYGPQGLACILALPPENFVLAYGAALAEGERLKDSQALAPSTYAAARQLAASRSRPARLDACLAPA